MYSLCFHDGSIDKTDVEKHRFISRVIKVWTRGRFSHVELCRGEMSFVDGKIISDGKCFSASGYENIVREKVINFSHPEFWTIVKLPDEYDHVDATIRARCASVLGAKYDYLGAIFSIKKNGPEVSTRYYCSEVCNHVLRWYPTGQSPEDLFNRAISKGGQVINA